jgi:hypothetical protein
LVSSATELLREAESVAKDGRLVTIVSWIDDSINGLVCELFRPIAATVKVLEKRQAEERGS